MNHLSLVALIAAGATFGVASAEEKCTKKLGDLCDRAKDKPCFTTQSLLGAEFWVHLECNGVGLTGTKNYGKWVMEVASSACKKLPAEHRLTQVVVGSVKYEDVKCSDDIKATDTIDGRMQLWKHEKSMEWSPREGIYEAK